MVPSKDDGTSKVNTNSPAVELIVIPTPDGNDTVIELLLARSMNDDDVVTLLPIEVKLSDTSVPLCFIVNGPLVRLVLTYSQK